MNNKVFLFYKPLRSFSRFLFRNTVNNQIAQNVPQRVVFSERIISCMRNIDMVWKRSKDNKKFQDYVYLSCKENPDLLSYAIDMIKCASSRGMKSDKLVYELIKAFNSYFKSNKLQFSPTLDQNIDVLSAVLKFKHYPIVQSVCDTFMLYDRPLVYKPFIESLIFEGKYIEAAYLTSALQLQKEFDIKEILLPLLLKGNVQPATLYMTNYPDLQVEIAKYLDGYINTKNIPPVEKPGKVSLTLSTIVKVFEIPLDNCPNLQFFRSKGAINILVRRYSDQAVSETTFVEMIKNIVQDNDDLKRFLIRKLLVRTDKKTALQMAKVLNIDVQDVLPETDCEILDECNQTENLIVDNNEENFETIDISDDYLTISLKPEEIKVIDTKENFISCIDDICENYKMIGIDSEWKPHFGLSKDKLSLIQLAAHDKVYIIDVFLLSEKLESKHWDKFLDDIFGNPNIVKLGCGIVSDVNMILDSIKGTEGKAVKFSHILDMVLLYHKLHEVYPVEMKYGGDSDKAVGDVKGLSSMCEVILGKPLNKENRLCNWEIRPLNQRQLHYAALDAHCLLQMYDKLREESIEKKMNFDHIANVAKILTTSQWRPKKRHKGSKTEKAFQVHTAVPVENLKIVIDSSFENQGKELRKLGADVIILQRDDTIKKAVELSEKEGRIVVCSEKIYHQIKEKVNKGFCYYFPSLDEKQIKVTDFLQHFNARVSTKSILSRCVNCNSKDGIELSSGDIEILHRLGNIDGSINSKLRDNINSFSNELKVVLSDILNCNVDIKILSANNSSHSSEFAFLCKTCGHVS